MNFGFNFGFSGGGILYPPVSEELLVWLKGDDNDIDLKLDSYESPDAENWVMSQSNCVTLNGVDEYGALDTDITLSGDFEISCNIDITRDSSEMLLSGAESYVRRYLTYWRVKLNNAGGYYSFTSVTNASGLLTLARSGTDLTLTCGGQSQTTSQTLLDTTFTNIGVEGATGFLEGELYNLTLQDSTQDIHFRLAEGSGLTSYDDTGAHSITWTGVEADLWAGTQDTYHGNAVEGWWEIDLDDVKYPYAVSGFDTLHQGGTFNACETSYAPEETPLGTMNVGDVITVPFNVPADGAMTYDGTCTASISTTTNEITVSVAGTIRNIEVTGTMVDTGDALNPDDSEALNPDDSTMTNP